MAEEKLEKLGVGQNLLIDGNYDSQHMRQNLAMRGA